VLSPRASLKETAPATGAGKSRALPTAASTAQPPPTARSSHLDSHAVASGGQNSGGQNSGAVDAAARRTTEEWDESLGGRGPQATSSKARRTPAPRAARVRSTAAAAAAEWRRAARR